MKKENKNIISPLSFNIYVEIYEYYILFSINETNKQFETFLKATLYPKDYIKVKTGCGEIFNQTHMGKCFMAHDSNKIVIRIRDKNNTHNTLAHEIKHCVDFIMRKIGLPAKRSTDEAYAYLTGWIHGECYRKINEKS